MPSPDARASCVLRFPLLVFSRIRRALPMDAWEHFLMFLEVVGRGAQQPSGPHLKEGIVTRPTAGTWKFGWLIGKRRAQLAGAGEIPHGATTFLLPSQAPDEVNDWYQVWGQSTQEHGSLWNSEEIQRNLREGCTGGPSIHSALPSEVSLGLCFLCKAESVSKQDSSYFTHFVLKSNVFPKNQLLDLLPPWHPKEMLWWIS